MLHELADQLAQELEYELEDEHETGLEFEDEPEWTHFLENEGATAHEQEWEQARHCPGPRRETVSRFPRYQNAVRSLPPPEQQKIRSFANLIRQSFRPGCQPIRTVRLMGHADRDIQRGPAFEKRLSVDRARAVEQALKGLIGSPAISSRIAWQPDGVGASSLIVPNPRTEPERALNRRVEISLLFKRPVPPTPGDMTRAVRENRRYARSLGWQAYASAIMRFLGFATSIPSESVFARAVARWQGSQGLNPNGIIGPQTLARIRAALESLKSFPGDDTRPAVSSQEIPPDPGVLRQLQREFQYEAGDEADKFVTEQVFGFPEGHKLLTELAAAGLPITKADLDALRDGVARVDDLTKAFDAPEQRRHTLRRNKCQAVSDALSEARNHLMHLHSLVLTVPNRRTQFKLIGEAVHLIQDSYSTAHTERRWGGAGGVHPILFIRFFGFQGSCRFPFEHRVVPPPDPRDTIKARGTLTPFARESVSASREYLAMTLRHIASPGLPSIPVELRTFMDKHLSLDPSPRRRSAIPRVQTLPRPVDAHKPPIVAARGGAEVESQIRPGSTSLGQCKRLNRERDSFTGWR